MKTIAQLSEELKAQGYVCLKSSPEAFAAAQAYLRVMSLLHGRLRDSFVLYQGLKDGMVSVVVDGRKQTSGLFSENMTLEGALEFLGEEPDR